MLLCTAAPNKNSQKDNRNVACPEAYNKGINVYNTKHHANVSGNYLSPHQRKKLIILTKWLMYKPSMKKKGKQVKCQNIHILTYSQWGKSIDMILVIFPTYINRMNNLTEGI